MTIYSPGSSKLPLKFRSILMTLPSSLRVPKLTSPAGRFGSLICFESTFSGYSRDYVRLGADFLVNITNDGWFGGATGPLQHSESAVQRAIENGVTMLRSANTGISMLIDPAGRVVESIGLDREGMLLVSVPTLSSRTPYTRFGQWIMLWMAILNLAFAFAWHYLSAGKR